MIEQTGAFVPTVATQTNLQNQIQSSLRIAQNAPMLANLATLDTVGPLGAAKRLGARLGLKTPGAETDLSSTQKIFAADFIRALKSDGQIAEAERRKLLEDIDVDVIDNPARFRRSIARSARLLIESNKNSFQAAGLPIPEQLQTANLDPTLWTVDELMEGARNGLFQGLSPEAAADLFDNAPFSAGEGFELK